MTASPRFPNVKTNPSIDHRRYPRVEISVPGRYMTSDGTEHVCTVRNFSFGGIGFDSDHEVAINDHIISYIENLGRFEGVVARLYEGGFAIRMEIKGPRLERVAQKVDFQTARIERESKNSAPTSMANTARDRMETQLILEGGRSSPCKVIDVSLTGVKLVTHMRPPLGAHVTIGTMKGHVQMHTSEGILITFDATEHQQTG